MHVVCLGSIKRLLTFWIHGPQQCKLVLALRQEISNCLQALRGAVPSEFARQPRSLTKLDRWKATKFHQFLLYTGPVILRDILPEGQLDHFMSDSWYVNTITVRSRSERSIPQLCQGFAETLRRQCCGVLRGVLSCITSTVFSTVKMS